MEPENEVVAGSILPVDHIGEGGDQPFNLETRHNVHNHDGGHLMAPHEYLQREDHGHIHAHHGEHHTHEMPPSGHAHIPHSEHHSRSMGLHDILPRENSGPMHMLHEQHGFADTEPRGARERIANLQADLAHAEKVLIESRSGFLTEISHLQGELHKSKTDLEAASVGQKKLSASESEATRLAQELSNSRDEVSHLKKSLQTTKEEQGELSGQVDVLKEKVSMLQEDLSTSDMKAKKVEESLLLQGKAHEEELATKAAEQENLSKAYCELQAELEGVRNKVQDLEVALRAASKQVEECEKEARHQEAISKEARDEVLSFKSVLQAAEAKSAEVEQAMESLKGQLCDAKAQVLDGDQLKQLLEEMKSDKRKVEEECGQVKEKLARLEGDFTNEKAQTVDLEQKLESAQVKLKDQEDCVMALEGNMVLIKEHAENLEGKLKGAEGDLKAKEEVVCSLQSEIVNLKEKVAEGITKAEENLKQREGEHQEQLTASEVRSQALEKTMSQLEEKTAQLQDSLGVVGSEAEIARKKVVELELELEGLLQNKSKSDESAVELQLQLRSTEEMLCKQVESLKVAEANAEKANEQASHLQTVLNSTEEKLKAREEMVESLQVQVSDLTSREAKSVEQLKEVEEGLQKMQLELQTKLETSEGNYKALVSQLEEKAAQLQEFLAAALSEGEIRNKRVSDLELEVEGLRHNRGELEEKARFLEEKCSQHENSAEGLRTRGFELEGLIAHHKTQSDDAFGKVVALEATLADTQSKGAELEMKLKLTQDNTFLLENTLGARVAELERCAKDYEAKVSELELACGLAKSTKQDTLEKLQHTEKMLVERQTEVNLASNKIHDLELSVEAMEVDLKDALKREKLVIEEKTLVTEKIEKLEALTAQLETDKLETESRVDEHKSMVERGKADLYEASVHEGKLREEILRVQEANSKLQDMLSKIEMENQAMVAQLHRMQKSFVEVNEQLVAERQQLQQQIATIMQENGDLSERCASAQEKLHATIAAAEVSAKQLEEASLKESLVGAEVEDLKVQLNKAMDAFAQTEKLERTLKDSISTEEHQTQINHLLESARISESKLAEAEEQLSKSKLEMRRVEKVINEQETRMKELEVKTLKAEVVDAQPAGSTKTRELEVNEGKVRNRKKKGVRWDVDGDVASATTKSVEKPTTTATPAHSFNHFLPHALLIALLSLSFGFWVAVKIHS